MSKTITLGARTGEHISIDPIGWVDREGWFQANVEISIQSFNGVVEPYFEVQDFKRFHEQVQKLYKELKGSAVLSPIEEQFSLTLTGDGKGHIEAKGIAYAHATYGSCLEFEFDIDQTFLPHLIRSLKRLLDENASSI